jgi:type I restriction enzyme S subunit
VKAGWRTQRLGELCEIVKGRKPHLKAQASEGDLPYLVAKVIRGSQEPEFAARSDRNSIPVSEDETIIICDGSNSGEVFTGYKGILSSTMGKLVIKGEINDCYLRAFLESTFEVFNGTKTGAAIPHLDKEALYALTFSYPSLSEQRRIVTILDDAFTDIATAKANAEKNLQNARSIFQTHLDSFFESNSNKKQEKLLMDALADQPRNGWSPPAANHSDTGTPVLTLSAVTGFKFRPEKIKHTSAPTNTDLHYWVVNGDLLLTRSNTPELVGHVAVVSDITQPTIYPDLIMRMNADPHKAINRFLYYQLRSTKLRRIIMSRAHGANPTMKKVGKNDVQTLPIWLPPLDEQQKITGELEELEASSVNLGTIYRQKLTALDDLKKSLRHQAFSGQLTQ